MEINSIIDEATDIHPFDDPDSHIFVDATKPIKEFVRESMRFIEESELL